MRFYAGVSCVLAFLPLVASGKTNVVPAVRLDPPPTIDGVVEEQEWSAAPGGEGFVEEATGVPAEETGRFWLGYDGRYVYFAARLRDPDPSRIQANEYRTNASLAGDDSVTLTLDLFGRMNEFNRFSMNPRGGTQIEIAGGRALKREWVGEFVARGRVTAEGWEVEARIPWEIMTLPPAGARTVRFNVRRYTPRTQRRTVWQYTGGGQVENTGRWEGVEIPALGRRRAISALPFAILGVERDEETDEASFASSVGLDFKTALTDSIELVGTVNPDFRNVENQILSLDFSYTERLPDETRPFFLEGSQFRRTGFSTRLFASQRVGAFDAGFNAYGRWGEAFEFALLDIVDFGKRNAVVLSTAYRPRPRSNVTFAYVGNRETGADHDGAYVNVGQGIGPFFLYAQGMWSRDAEGGSGRHYSAGLFYNQPGLEATLDYTEVSPDFFPRLGFVDFRDYRGFSASAEWTRLHPRGVIAETEVRASAFEFRRLSSGAPFRRGARLRMSATDRAGLDVDVDLETQRFQENDDYLVAVSLEKPRRSPFRGWEASMQIGRRRGEPYRSFGFDVNYRPVEPWQVSLRAQWVDSERDRRQIVLTSSYDLGRDQALAGRAVWRDGDVNAYVSYRRSGNRGAEYFVIVGDPNSREFEPSVLFKVVWPVELRF